MFLRNGQLLLLLLLRLLFLLLFVFHKMTYGNDFLPRHFPVHFYDYVFLFFIFCSCIAVRRVYVLFIFICFNKYKICPDNQPIYTQFRETKASENKVLIYACSTQILRINTYINLLFFCMANEMGRRFRDESTADSSIGKQCLLTIIIAFFGVYFWRFGEIINQKIT